MGHRRAPLPMKNYTALREEAEAKPSPFAEAEDPMEVLWSEMLALRVQMDRIEKLLKGRQ